MTIPRNERTETKMPIQVPPIDPEKVALILHQQQEAVQAELQRLEEAKVVSRETMQREVSF